MDSNLLIKNNKIKLYKTKNYNFNPTIFDYNNFIIVAWYNNGDCIW
jgi:hypothetical protein